MQIIVNEATGESTVKMTAKQKLVIRNARLRVAELKQAIKDAGAPEGVEPIVFAVLESMSYPKDMGVLKQAVELRAMLGRWVGADEAHRMVYGDSLPKSEEEVS